MSSAAETPVINPSPNGREANYQSNHRDSLDQVLGLPKGGPVLELQEGLYRLGENRALSSGKLKTDPQDVEQLQNHARATARDTYRDPYDPKTNIHDAMHEAEFRKFLVDREEDEKITAHAFANLRDAEATLAQTPKAGDKPYLKAWLSIAFIVAIALTLSPTLHDCIFFTLTDDLISWFLSFVCASFVAGMVTWAVLNGRHASWNRAGVVAGLIMGVGFCLVRLSSSRTLAGICIAVGLTVVEFAAVLFLDHVSRYLARKEDEWYQLHTRESQAAAARDAATAEYEHRKRKLAEINTTIQDKIAYVEDRHNRHIHILELEEVAVKAILDGYNAGININVGRINGTQLWRKK